MTIRSRNRLSVRVLLGLALLAGPLARAATVHVWSGSPTPGEPYTTWDTAAHDVQTAVHYAQANIATYPTVLVTNGVYAITNAQIHITESLTLVSVNGPEHTVLYRDASLDNRVLYIDNAGALLEGFTVSNGWARGTTSALLGRNGGGIYLNNGTVRHCHILNNTADRSGTSTANNQSGGGIYMVAGLVEHCVIAGNQVLGEAVYGGGISINGAGTLRYSMITNNVISSGSGTGRAGSGVRITNASALVHDCLIAGNRHILGNATSNEGAGVTISAGTMRNCTVTGNTAINQPTAGVHRTGGSVVNTIAFGNTTDLASGLNPQVNTTTGFTHSCAPELTSGTGNVPLDPSFVAPGTGNYRLAAASPAINAGSNTGVTANDLDGNTRIVGGTVDMGAFEFNPATGPLACDFIAVTRAGFDSLNVTFTAAVSGVPSETDITGYHWDFGDGQTDGGPGKDTVTHVYGPSTFTVTLTVTNSQLATATRARTAYINVYPSTVYVAPDGGNNPPYVSWTDAATDIVDAVAAAGVVDGVGSLVLMTNGAYGVTSELFLQKGITLRGVNGPEHTALYRVGAQTAGQPHHRVLRIGNPDAVVDGLSITNGYGTEIQGLGVYMHAGTLTNCHVRLNRVPQKSDRNNMQGAGIYMLGGLVTHCLIADNWLWHEQARGAGVNIEGGTLRNSIVRNNLIRGNSHERGSGIYMNNSGTVVENCLVVSNITYGATTSTDGPAVFVNHGTLRNTTVAANSSTNHIVSGVYRGSNGTIVNTIAFGNVSVRGDSQEAQVGSANALPTGFTYSCAPELTSGTGNISANPELKADFTLEAVSIVIDEGDNNAVATPTDLAGNPRIIGGTVDMGAYEFDPLAGDLECSLAATLTDGFDTLTTTFTAAATGPNTDLVYYWWDFGDGNTVDGAALGSVTHTYTTLGTFDVSLTVENEDGDQADTTRSAYITTHASTVYVSPSGNHEPPFADWPSAATNIQAAVDTGWHDGTTGTLIRVAAAAYPLMATLELPVGVTLRADDGPGATTLYRAGSGEYSVVRIAHAAAVVDGFTITNGLSTSSAVWGAGVHISAGTLRNSHVLYNYATGGNSRRGGGVYLASGLVEDCLIAHNSMVIGQSISGGGIYLDGGMLRRSIIRDNTLSGWPSGTGVHAGGSSIVESCLIVNNVSTGSSSYDTGAGLRLGSAGAVVRNTTISGNTANPVLSTTVGGLYRSDGTVINTIVFGNTVGGDASDINTTTGVTYSCAPELTSGMGNIVSDPDFRNPAAGDYTLASGSGAIGVGYYDDTWMLGATDLAGNPRFKKDLTVDMGAYETQQPGGSLFLLR